VICYLICCHTQLAAAETTDNVSRKVIFGKREIVLTEKLLEMPAVHTDRFIITGFATYTAQGTALHQNLQTTE
jgi:hypothetical protein